MNAAFLTRALILVCVLTFASTASAAEYWTCDVATPSVVTEETQTVVIHSAGYLAINGVFSSNTDYDTVIEGVHRLERQSDMLLMDIDFAETYGEVITYTRSSVPRGYAYLSKLAGSITSSGIGLADPRPGTTSCQSGLLVVEDPVGGGGDSGGGGGGGGGGESDPTLPPSGSPILIDLGGGGFKLTSLDDGVAFDLDGDGTTDQVAWTQDSGEDVWLALDRNQNGFIDDGTELFGNYTLQPAGQQFNGYRALAVYDAASEGGDGDGWISAADRIYDSLVVWNDSNHDGLSQAPEIRPLADAGILAIDLSSVEHRRTDRYGSQYRYSSNVRLERGSTKSTDVFLLVDWGS